MNEKNKSLRSQELLPTQEKDRTMSLADYILLWAGMTINIVAFSLGAQYYDGGNGLSPVTMIWVMLVGYGIVTVFTTMVGDIGTKYGIPFAAFIRAPFGYKGSCVASVIRALPGMYWFGFLTYVGAEALNHIIGMFIPGFDNVTLMIIVFAIVQILNTMYGLEAMAKFDWIAIPALAIMFGAILVTTLTKYNISIPDIMGTQTAGGYPIPYAIAGIAGGWITMALNGSDLSRQIKHVEGYEKMSFFGRNRRAIVGQVIGLMFVGVFTMLIGAASGIVSGYWDLNDVIPDLFTNKVALVLCFLTLAFAQWSTNTAANLMPPSMAMLNIFPKMSYKLSVTICGVISILMMPWKLESQGGFLVMVQGWISQMLGPIIGVMLVDYFLIRKMKLNVKDLYCADGQYNYYKGFNISAILTLVISFVFGLFCGSYAFFAGLGCSVVLYYILMKNVTMKKYEQHIGEEILFDPDVD
ncbi:MAG: cytosine permease [Eubacteriales bacterium]|nr:cytosine permease [Eubacteriales bacterium]